MFNRLVWLIVLVVLSVIIAYYFIPDFSRNVIPLLRGLRYEWVCLALIATLVHFFAEVSRWWVYLRESDVRDTGLFGKLFGIFSLTALVTYLLPAKLGIPVRVFLLTSRLRMRLMTVSAYLVLDGALSYGLWVLLAFALYLAYGKSLPVGQLHLILIAVAACLMAVLLFRRRLLPVLKNIRSQFSLISPSGLIMAIAILLLDIAGYVIRHAAILAAVNIELSFGVTAFVTIVSIAAGFISMLPMGLGAYDVTLIYLLAAAGVPLDSAVVVPLLNRAANVTISTLLGLPATHLMGESLMSLGARFKQRIRTSGMQ